MREIISFDGVEPGPDSLPEPIFIDQNLKGIKTNLKDENGNPVLISWVEYMAGGFKDCGVSGQ